MPKYLKTKIAGCFLYFTSHCTLEVMHVHANSDGKLKQSNSLGKFWVGETGDTRLVKNRGLTEKQISIIQSYIKDNYELMYKLWKEYSEEGFFKGV